MEIEKGDKLIFKVIAGDMKVNTLMSCFDLRHPGKVFANFTTLTATADGTKSIFDIFDKLKISLSENFILVSLEFEGKLVNGRCLTDIDLFYKNPEIKEVSDGQRSYMI